VVTLSVDVSVCLSVCFVSDPKSKTEGLRYLRHILQVSFLFATFLLIRWKNNICYDIKMEQCRYLLYINKDFLTIKRSVSQSRHHLEGAGHIVAAQIQAVHLVCFGDALNLNFLHVFEFFCLQF